MAQFAELASMISSLSASARDTVHCLHAQAVGYVWGWQDAGGAPKDSNQSYEFGQAYAMHATRYALGQVGGRHSVPDAFRRYVAGQPIEH